MHGASISRCSHIGVQRIYFWTYDSIMFGMSYTISIPKFIMHLNWCFHYLRKDTNLSYAGFRGATEFSWPTKSDWSTMYLHTWQQMCWTRYQKRLYGWLMPCTCIFFIQRRTMLEQQWGPHLSILDLGGFSLEYLASNLVLILEQFCWLFKLHGCFLMIN